MSYERRIVCDIDDTISLTLNRDWNNAKPIQSVIDKINTFYDNGWEVYLITARGQLSCNGDVQSAENKYRKSLEEWLVKHGVKYHVLSFNKILAQYYIDDKGLRPDEFVNLDIQILNNGLSKAIVERRGNKVYKTHPNSKQAVEWYMLVDRLGFTTFDTPKIHTLIGDTICMDFIQQSFTTKRRYEDFIHILTQFHCVNHMDIPNFDSFTKRIVEHIDLSNSVNNEIINKWAILHYLREIWDFMNTQRSFCHGDLSLDNVLYSEGKIYLIDPIYLPDMYSSWLLDASKLLHSIRRNNLDVNPFIKEFEFTFGSFCRTKILLILEITQWIRILKYVNASTRQEYIIIINNLIRDLKDVK